MSTDNADVIALSGVELEVSVIWGRKCITIRDLEELANQPNASVDFNQAMGESLDLMVGDTCIGKARIIDEHPVRLEVVELTGE